MEQTDIKKQFINGEKDKGIGDKELSDRNIRDFAIESSIKRQQ